MKPPKMSLVRLIKLVFYTALLNHADVKAQMTADNWWAGGFSVGHSRFLTSSFSSGYLDFKGELWTINLQTFGPVSGKRELFFDLGFYLPRYIESNKEVHAKLYGGYLGVPWQSFRIRWIDGSKNNENLIFGTPICIGTDAGWLFLRQAENSSRNFFLNLRLKIEPRFILYKRLIVGGEIGLGYDLTKKEWKSRNKHGLDPLPHQNTIFEVKGKFAWIF